MKFVQIIEQFEELFGIDSPKKNYTKLLKNAEEKLLKKVVKFKKTTDAQTKQKLQKEIEVLLDIQVKITDKLSQL